MKSNPKSDRSERLTGFDTLHLNMDWSRVEFRSKMLFVCCCCCFHFKRTAAKFQGFYGVKMNKSETREKTELKLFMVILEFSIHSHFYAAVVTTVCKQ